MTNGNILVRFREKNKRKKKLLIWQHILFRAIHLEIKECPLKRLEEISEIQDESPIYAPVILFVNFITKT